MTEILDKKEKFRNKKVIETKDILTDYKKEKDLKEGFDFRIDKDGEKVYLVEGNELESPEAKKILDKKNEDYKNAFLEKRKKENYDDSIGLYGEEGKDWEWRNVKGETIRKEINTSNDSIHWSEREFTKNKNGEVEGIDYINRVDDSGKMIKAPVSNSENNKETFDNKINKSKESFVEKLSNEEKAKVEKKTPQERKAKIKELGSQRRGKGEYVGGVTGLKKRDGSTYTQTKFREGKLEEAQSKNTKEVQEKIAERSTRKAEQLVAANEKLKKDKVLETEKKALETEREQKRKLRVEEETERNAAYKKSLDEKENAITSKINIDNLKLGYEDGRVVDKEETKQYR